MIRGSLRNPYVVAVAAIALVVLGVVATGRIPTDLLPEFKTPAVQILTLYPGMPAEVMERDIMSRLERWTGQASGIEHQEARAMQGVCVVKDFFHEDVDPNAAMSQVSSLAMSDLYYLPPGTVPPMVMPFDPTASIPLCLVSVSSEALSEQQLYDIAYFEMRNQLQAISGVIAPAVYGGVLRRIHVYVDPLKLRARGLSPMDVVRATQESNVFIPTGSAKFGDQEFLIVSNAMVPEVKDLDDVPVAVRDGRPILIRDIGYAKDSHEIQTNIVRVNGRRQVYIPIYRQPGANTLEVVDSVRARTDTILERVKTFYPDTEDLRIDVVMDQSNRVRASISELRRAAMFGAVLVAAVILLFLLSARSTVIVLLALPLSVLAALIALAATGNSVNAMTLGGLSLAVGMLMDQSIVVLENVSRHLGMGKSRIRAALDGAREVAQPVLVATLTSVAVFLPVVFLTGMAGFLFTPMALTVTSALAASLVVALTVVPVACAAFLKPKPSRTTPFDRVSAAYASIVRGSLRVRWLMALGAAALLAVGGVWGSSLGTELFPPVDSGQFMILARAASGTRLERTERLMERVEAVVADVVGAPDPGGDDPTSDVQMTISNIGVLLDWPAAYTPNTGPMDAFVLVQLKDEHRRSTLEHVRELRRVLPEQVPGVEFAFDTGGMLTAALNQGLPSPIDVQIQGSSLEVLNEIAHAVADACRDVEGAVDVRVAQRIDAPALRVDVDRTKAALLGFTQQDVVENLVTATNSSISFAKSFWIDETNGNHYFVGAQYPEEDIVSIETLGDIPITGDDVVSPSVLRNVATIERTTEPSVVDHRNITRVFDVYVNVDGRDAGSVAADIERAVAESERVSSLLEEHGGYSITTRGEIGSMRESFRQFAGGLYLAVALVYLVMVAQFRSFRAPLVILTVVPLALVGVVAALRVTGTAVSIPAFMGALMCVGLVVNYAVLMVDFANRRRAEGLSKQDAIVDAARTRLRPILMTSFAAGMAMLPIAVGESANAPLARAVVGGLIAASVVTLFVVPSFFVLLTGRGRPFQVSEELA